MTALKRGGFLMFAAAFLFQPVHAITVAVTITGRAETAYELNVSGIRKTGRLGPLPGATTIRDQVEVGNREKIVAGLTFRGLEGVLATCPEIRVALEGMKAQCEPVFELTAESSAGRLTCTARCESKNQIESEGEGVEEEEETLYTFYSPSMSPTPDLLIYSALAGDGQRGAKR
jgi:hypothetical protein